VGELSRPMNEGRGALTRLRQAGISRVEMEGSKVDSGVDVGGGVSRNSERKTEEHTLLFKHSPVPQSRLL
jgi:hypothetical protein